MLIIDTPYNTSKKIPALLANNVGVVIRYYNFSNSSTFPEKRIELAEAQLLSASNIKIAVVFQQKQNATTDFSLQTGISSGTRAYRYAKDVIGQPAGSAIYFSVDYDASENEVDNNIIPFFQGIQQAFNTESGNSPEYKIGVYGSGLVSKSLLAKNLITYTWLTMSSGFNGSKQALDKKQYNLAQKAPSTTLAGIDVDYNIANPTNPDFGQFSIGQDESPHAGITQQFPKYKVSARSGLRLRGGPGLQFERIGLLKLNQIVYVTAEIDGWAKIDIEGDGNIDGFASLHFLEKV
mgnify:CR=1 FL=1